MSGLASVAGIESREVTRAPVGHFTLLSFVVTMGSEFSRRAGYDDEQVELLACDSAKPYTALFTFPVVSTPDLQHSRIYSKAEIFWPYLALQAAR